MKNRSKLLASGSSVADSEGGDSVIEPPVESSIEDLILQQPCPLKTRRHFISANDMQIVLKEHQGKKKVALIPRSLARIAAAGK